MERVWLITGASTGFGKAVAEQALGHGELIVATVRTSAGLHALNDLVAEHSSDKVFVLKCDVTSCSDIISAFNAAYEKFGRVDVVFNNAGTATWAEAETEQDEFARKTFEVNFWGATNVMKEAVRSFRERNPHGVGGRLLNNSSMAGLSSVSLLASYYIASKHALEGFADTLAQELDPAWNIKPTTAQITSIQPGFFKTDLQNKVPLLNFHPAYADPNLPASRVREVLSQGYSTTEIAFGDAHKGAAKIYAVSKLDQPPLWLPLGKDCLERTAAHAAEFQKVVEQFAHWSDDLLPVESS